MKLLNKYKEIIFNLMYNLNIKRTDLNILLINTTILVSLYMLIFTIYIIMIVFLQIDNGGF